MGRDWIDYLPPEQRDEAQARRQRNRWLQKTRNRLFWVKVSVGTYGVWCLYLVISGKAMAFGFALIPLIAMPAIGALAWWLTYKEFHE